MWELQVFLPILVLLLLLRLLSSADTSHFLHESTNSPHPSYFLFPRRQSSIGAFPLRIDSFCFTSFRRGFQWKLRSCVQNNVEGWHISSRQCWSPSCIGAANKQFKLGDFCELHSFSFSTLLSSKILHSNALRVYILKHYHFNKGITDFSYIVIVVISH